MNEILLGIAVFTGLVMALSVVVLGARVVLWGGGRAQLNVNAELLERHGFEVKGGVIDLILRDFQKSKATHGNYPQIPFQSVKIPIWDTATRNAYIDKHAHSHEWNSDGYGVDAISVYMRMIVPFRVQNYNDTTIVALPGRYAFGGGWGEFQGEYKDFIGDFPSPSTKYKRCLVSLNTATNALNFKYTGQYVDEDDVPFPTTPSGYMRLAYVRFS